MRPKRHSPLSALVLAAGCLLSPPNHADYRVQVGAFSNEINAQAVTQALMTLGYPAGYTRDAHNGLNRVTAGVYTSRSEAEVIKQSLANANLAGLVIPSPVDHPAVLVAAAGDDMEGLDELFQETPEPPTEGTVDDTPMDAPSSLDELFDSAPESAEADSPAGDLFADTSPADEEKAAPGLAVEGFFQSELAYATEAPEHWSKFRHLLDIGSSGTFSNGIGWKVSGRLIYDSVFDIEDDHYPPAVGKDRRHDAMFRETYLDIPAGDWEFRVGRQHIVWGEMVGLFFADVVSAKDLRQFVAQDFELLRIPQWAIRAEHFMDDLYMEAIWVPYMTYDEVAVAGDDFFSLPTAPPTGYGVAVLGEDKPPHTLSNSAYGLRLSYLTDGWDLSGFYYRSVDSAATMVRSVVPGPVPALVYQPEHRKIHQLGGTLAKDVGSNTVIKGEAIYTANKFIAVEDLADTDGLVESDVLDYVLSAESTLDSGARVNLQLFQRWYTDHDKRMVPDEVESGYSLYATTTLMNGKIEPEITWIQGVNQGDWMARPKVFWHFARDWRASLGADLFGGRQSTLFGQFDNADRVYADVRFTF